MEQMADEMTLRKEAKDKGRGNAAEESSAWMRGGTDRMQSDAEVSDWRLDAASETKPGETSRDADAQQEHDHSLSPLLSLKMYLRRSTSAESSITDSLSSSEHSNTGVDCAGMVLNCLFCRFYDMILMLPSSCERVAHHCCFNYKQVVTTAESTPNSNEDSCIDLDCGLFTSCEDTADCLELAMEVSELCYR
ncbi:myoD family inhibitor domain-containing protein 2 [Antennarius striatus]|uniref:myoD family inhibitor domain-containing protein 2 n=1 Tax=Antennarius striatus TaxID=241820 RepID=UPI0035AF8AA8